MWLTYPAGLPRGHASFVYWSVWTETVGMALERRSSMADDQDNSPGVISGVMQEFVAQLRGVTERLEGLTGLGVSLPSIPSFGCRRACGSCPRPAPFPRHS